MGGAVAPMGGNGWLWLVVSDNGRLGGKWQRQRVVMQNAGGNAGAMGGGGAKSYLLGSLDDQRHVRLLPIELLTR
jgi:hypothetical protein